MHVHLALFAVLFGSVSFAVGAATGRKPLALAVGAGARVLAYAAGGIIPQVDGLEWVKQYSAFYWLNGEQPLQNGLDVGHVSIMLGLSTALVALGTLAFERRDVGV